VESTVGTGVWAVPPYRYVVGCRHFLLFRAEKCSSETSAPATNYMMPQSRRTKRKPQNPHESTNPSDCRGKSHIAHTCLVAQHAPAFMEPENSLQYKQNSTTGPALNQLCPAQIITLYFLEIVETSTRVGGDFPSTLVRTGVGP
jgi:hypothetical protein